MLPRLRVGEVGTMIRRPSCKRIDVGRVDEAIPNADAKALRRDFQSCGDLDKLVRWAEDPFVEGEPP